MRKNGKCHAKVTPADVDVHSKKRKRENIDASTVPYLPELKIQKSTSQFRLLKLTFTHT